VIRSISEIFETSRDVSFPRPHILETFKISNYRKKTH